MSRRRKQEGETTTEQSISRRDRRRRRRRKTERAGTVLAVVTALTAHQTGAPPAGAQVICDDNYNTVMPHSQRIYEAEQAMSQESSYGAPYDQSPLTGTIVFDAFIAQSEHTLWSHWYSLVANYYWPVIPSNAQVKGLGDDRGLDRYFSPADSRGMFVLDSRSVQVNTWGLAYGVANHTTYRFQLVFPGYTQTVYNHSFSARQLLFDWKSSGRQWYWVDWLSEYRVRLRYELLAAGPFPASAPLPSIQHQYVFNTETEQMSWMGNDCPSRGVYRYFDCNYFGRVNHFNATDIFELTDVPSFAHDAPVTGVTPAWKVSA